MNALWDRNQGISRAVEPLPGTTGSAETAGLATRPDHCKRLLSPQADSDVGSGASNPMENRGETTHVVYVFNGCRD
jgi:hypothetical protein